MKSSRGYIRSGKIVAKKRKGERRQQIAYGKVEQSRGSLKGARKNVGEVSDCST